MPRRDANDIDKRIGVNIARLRTIKGMARVQLGEALPTPVRSQQIAKYEEGTNRVPASTLVEIAGVLECKVVELFEGVADLLPDQIGELHVAEGMFKDFNTLSPGMQKAVKNLTKAITLELAKGFRS